MGLFESCPFCAGVDINYVCVAGHFVVCSDCGARIGSSEGEADAIKKWNTRASGSVIARSKKALTVAQLKERNGCTVYTMREGKVLQGTVKIGNVSLRPIVVFGDGDWVYMSHGLKFYDTLPTV